INTVRTRPAAGRGGCVGGGIGGDEALFAKMMTRKARALGMKNTVFKNASGLPDKEQVTTARDLALLGLALQDRFPTLYRYFSTRHFAWRGNLIGNHNHLLGHVEGVDGIKTGYTNASGFNLVTKVKRGDGHVIAVILGGRTAASRDEMMRNLIAENIRYATTGPRTAPRFAEAPPRRETTAAIPAPRGSADPIRPTPVRSFTVDKSGEVLSPIGDSSPKSTLSVSTFSHSMQ